MSISDKLLRLNALRNNILAATEEKGLDINGTTFENVHELWANMSGGEYELQEKDAIPSDVDVIVKPDDGYALSKVNIAAALGLQPYNIRKDQFLFGIKGTAEIEVTSEVPDYIPVQPEDAEEEYEKHFSESPPEDAMVLADKHGNITYCYFLDNWEITSYDPETTDFSAIGWRRLSYHTTGENAGTWTDDDFSSEASTGWNYLKHIISCTREKLYYNGVEVWPNFNDRLRTLAPQYNWFDKSAAGISSDTVTSVTFTEGYIPTGKETATWPADVDKTGFIMGYLISTDIIVSGNSAGKILANSDSSQMFYNLKQAKYLNLSSLDTSKVKDMSYMFNRCWMITSLDLSNFDTSNVTDMQYMFQECGSLTSLDVSNFDTSNVTNMLMMFQNCGSLTSLDVSNFDTSNVTNTSYMFQYCGSITSLDVSNFDTSNVTDMRDMFDCCRSLLSIDVSNFDTSKVKDMQGMFSECRVLTDLDLSNFDTSNVTTMWAMFDGSWALTGLDLSNFDTSNVRSMNYMFRSCRSLTNIYVGSGWTTDNADTTYMFSGCGTSTVTRV